MGKRCTLYMVLVSPKPIRYTPEINVIIYNRRTITTYPQTQYRVQCGTKQKAHATCYESKYFYKNQSLSKDSIIIRLSMLFNR